jgi:hypothetical protein
MRIIHIIYLWDFYRGINIFRHNLSVFLSASLLFLINLGTHSFRKFPQFGFVAILEIIFHKITSICGLD